MRIKIEEITKAYQELGYEEDLEYQIEEAEEALNYFGITREGDHLQIPKELNINRAIEIIQEALFILDPDLVEERPVTEEGRDYFNKRIAGQGDDGAYDYNGSFPLAILDSIQEYIENK